MGMDVYGKNQESEKGSYFRNNVWWWRPLWNYCEELHGDITNAVESGYSNDGDGLDAENALALGQRLLNDLATGVTAKYETEYREALAALPTSECNYCDGTGIRSDAVGIENGMPTRALSETDAIILGRTHGDCNACHGHGKVQHFATNYPFAVENVREFAEFLIECDGFEIC